MASIEPTSAIQSYTESMLPHVSRTFALTIPSLRQPLRQEVGLAYLLCRVADTIEDHPDIDRTKRDFLLGKFLDFAKAPAQPKPWNAFLDAWPSLESKHHEDLVMHTPELLAGLDELAQKPAHAIRECLEEMCFGMMTFEGRQSGRVVTVCEDTDQLEFYCHIVAGTVGILLTRLFAGTMGSNDWASATCLERGRRFGLGLQLTNILKDHESDKERGVSYLPPKYLVGGEAGAAMSVDGCKKLLDRTLGHLRAGLDYIQSIPVENRDMRLFCVYAHHMALATLAEIGGSKPGGRKKISRERVESLVSRAQSVVDTPDELAQTTELLFDQVAMHIIG